MKAKVLAVAVAAFFMMAGSSQAFQWHLSLFKAKAATQSYEREECERHRLCVSYGATCRRISESRIDCTGGNVDETAYGELECWNMYHWGVNAYGEVKLRTGKAHCGYLE